MKKIMYLMLAWSLFALQTALAAPEIKPTQESYTPDQEVVIEFSDLPGNQKDWIVITTPDSTAFKPGKNRQYSKGQKSGAMTFKALAKGKYEARLYLNYPIGGYKVHARSTFQVSPKAAATAASSEGDAQPAAATEKVLKVETSKAKFYLNEPVVVNFEGMPGNREDIIAIAPPSVHTRVLPQKWQYTANKKQGSMEFTGLESGKYSIRVYFEIVKHGWKVQQSYDFEIIDPPSEVKTEKAQYTADDPVVVQFSKLPGFKTDWIALSLSIKPDSVYDKTGTYSWRTGGLTEGSHEFPKLKPGKYQARLYYNFPAGLYIVKARHEFEVIDPDEAEEEGEDEEEDDDDEDEDEDDEDDEDEDEDE